MGFKSIVSPDDLKRGDLLKPGWYPVVFDEYNEKEANTDKSTNLLLTFKVQDGKNDGVRPRTLFNEKALGFGKNCWLALGIPYDEQIGFELSDDIIKDKIGTRLEIYVQRGKNEKTGNEFNEVKDYRPLKR